MDQETEIDRLIDEHRELMTMMGKLQRAIGQPDSDVDGVLDEMEKALAHHTEREETGLFHTLHNAEAPAEYMGLFEHDHGHLVELLESARRDRSIAGEFVKSLQAHMEREENDMFAAAEQLLTPADWAAIDAAVARLR